MKKVVSSLLKTLDSQVTTIMETNDLNTLDFNALIGSLVNYETILKSRGIIPKEEKALKAKSYILLTPRFLR